MKSKFFILLFIPFIYSSVKAQDSTKVTYGFKLGLNNSSTTRSSSTEEVNKVVMKSFITYHFSLVVDVPFSKSLSIQPAVSFTNKGQKKDLTGTSNDEQFKVAYLQLPVNLTYKYKNFFVGAGPYAGMALKGTVEKNSKKTDLDFGDTFVIGVGSSANSDWEKYDYGASMLLGYKYKKIIFNVNYDLGFKDVDPNPLYKSKTRTGAVSIGFMF